jgi:predicted PurR-regulated permease PerM
MLKPVLQNPWVQAFGVLVALGLVVILCWLLSPVLVPLFFAFLVAYILDPVVDFFERFRIPRSASIAVLTVLLLSVLIAIPAFLIPSALSEADRLISLATNRPEDQTMSDWLARWVERLPLDEWVKQAGWAPPEDSEFDPVAVIVARGVSYVRDHAKDFVQQHVSKFADAGQRAGYIAAFVFTYIGRSTYNLLLFIGNVVLFGFVSVYLLKDFDRVVAGARELLPLHYRSRAVDIVCQIDHNIHGWLRGQLFVCLCLGAMYAVGFTISGTPFAILIALMGGIASLVPYIGPIITVVPATLLTVVEFGTLDGHVVGVLITVAAAQALEGNVLTPKIVGTQVGLHPVWVILAVMVFASWFGFLGLMLAVPIAAVLKVFVMEAILCYKRSSLFNGDEPPAPPSSKRKRS